MEQLIRWRRVGSRVLHQAERVCVREDVLELPDGRRQAYPVMALTVYSSMVAKKMNLDAAKVKDEWVAGVFPGIQIVPSGVWAVNRAQEHGCTYCYAG